MNKDSYWLRSGMYTLLIQVSAMLFGLGGFMMLTRSLSKEDFGAWVLFLTVSSLVEVSRNALIQNALVKHLISADEKEHGFINTASLVINLLLSVGSIVLLFALSFLLGDWLNTPGIGYLLRVYIITTLILIPFSQSEFVHQANFDFRGVFFGHFMRLGGLFSYIAVCFFGGIQLQIEHLVWAHMFAAVGGAITLSFFARRYMAYSSKIDWKWVKELFNYGKYVFGTGISSMILNSIDTWMIAALLGGTSVTRGQQAVATYNAALRITNLVQVPTNAVAQMVFPQSARRIKTEGKAGAKFLYEKSVGVLLAMIIPGIIFVLLIPGFLIKLVAGEAYLDAVPILQITMLYGLFMPFGRQFGIILDSIGKPKINFYFILFSAGLNVVLNLIFITSLDSVEGAAYGTLTTYVVTFIGTQILLKRELNVNTLSVFAYAWKFYPEVIQIGKRLIRQKLAPHSVP